MHSYLSIHHLHLVGYRKTYSIPFYPGVNIIYGDSDTGKSSILEFINYLLGASSIELADEIIASVEYAALELEINGIDHTIKRDIFNPGKHIEVYRCIFSECSKNFPQKYAPNFNSAVGADGFFSDFLMDSLNFPKVQIKVAPSKIDSEVKRLSFRNLFKYIYLSQDDVGSKGFLDQSNGIKYTTNKEVFKYIFNVLDSSITELEHEISFKAKESASLLSKYKAVSDFLRETDYDNQVSLDDSINSIDETIEALSVELKTINSKMTANSESYQSIKAAFDLLSLNEKRVSIDILKTKDQIDRYTRLKNDYENDIAKINSILSAQTRIGELTTESNPCPVCDTLLAPSTVETAFNSFKDNTLTNEMSSLQKRKRSIQGLIEELSTKQRPLSAQLSSIQHDLIKAREMLDTESEQMITPYLTQRDALIKEVSIKSQLRVQLVNNLKIRNQQQKIYDLYSQAQRAIEQLQTKLQELRDAAPSLSAVLSTLGDNLNSYLKRVNIKNRNDISVSEKTFLPVIRGRDYYRITSGGLRTIASIGHLISLLEYAIDSDINHPRLLVIDTVGKYLGKTTKEKYSDETNVSEDVAEGISDPQKYQNIYEHMLALANKAEEKQVPCQIIIVDNDVPDTFINRFKTFIVAHYSSSGEGGLAKGLIDDIDE